MKKIVKIECGDKIRNKENKKEMREILAIQRVKNNNIKVAVLDNGKIWDYYSLMFNYEKI